MSENHDFDHYQSSPTMVVVATDNELDEIEGTVRRKEELFPEIWTALIDTVQLSRDGNVRLRVVEIFSEAFEQPKWAQAFIVSRGAMKSLVGALRDEDPRIQHRACTAMWRLLERPQGVDSFALTLDSMPSLVELLGHEWEKIRCVACCTVTNASIAFECKEKFAEIPGSMNKLLNILESGDDKWTKRCAIMAIHCMCEKSVRNTELLLGIDGALDRMSLMLKEYDESLVTPAVLAIGSISRHEKVREMFHQDPVAVHRLVKQILRTEDEGLLRACTRAIKPFVSILEGWHTSECEERKDDLSNLLSRLNSLLLVVDTDMQLAVTNLLAQLLQNEQSCIAFGNIPGAVGRMVGLLHSSNTSLRHRITIALASMCEHRQNREALLCVPDRLISDGLTTLIPLLNTDSEDLQRAAAFLMGTVFLSTSRCRDNLSRHKYGIIYLSQLLHAHRNDILSAASVALMKAFRLVKCRQAFVATNSMGQLVNCLNPKFPGTVRAAAVGAIMNAAESVQCRKQLADAPNGIANLVDMLRIDELDVAATTLGAFSNVLLHPKARETIARLPKGIPALAAYLSPGRSKAIYIPACRALAHAMILPANRTRFANFPESVKHMVMLLRNPDDDQVKLECVSLLDGLVVENEIREVLAKDCAIVKFLAPCLKVEAAERPLTADIAKIGESAVESCCTHPVLKAAFGRHFMTMWGHQGTIRNGGRRRSSRLRSQVIKTSFLLQLGGNLRDRASSSTPSPKDPSTLQGSDDVPQGGKGWITARRKMSHRGGLSLVVPGRPDPEMEKFINSAPSSPEPLTPFDPCMSPGAHIRKLSQMIHSGNVPTPKAVSPTESISGDLLLSSRLNSPSGKDDIFSPVSPSGFKTFQSMMSPRGMSAETFDSTTSSGSPRGGGAVKMISKRSLSIFSKSEKEIENFEMSMRQRRFSRF